MTQKLDFEVFVMPWKGHTLLGTTEHAYQGDPAQVHPLDVERDYLLGLYRQFFPGRSTEVLDAWSGVRVLPTGGAAFQRSRETQLLVDGPRRPRLISIFGGKLTGYRATALKVMAKMAPSLPPRQRVAETSQVRLEIPVTEIPVTEIPVTD